MCRSAGLLHTRKCSGLYRNNCLIMIIPTLQDKSHMINQNQLLKIFVFLYNPLLAQILVLVAIETYLKQCFHAICYDIIGQIRLTNVAQAYHSELDDGQLGETWKLKYCRLLDSKMSSAIGLYLESFVFVISRQQTTIAMSDVLFLNS